MQLLDKTRALDSISYETPIALLQIYQQLHLFQVAPKSKHLRIFPLRRAFYYTYDDYAVYKHSETPAIAISLAYLNRA
jgi:hypothetical protein